MIIRKALHRGRSDARRRSLFNNEKRCLLLLNSRKHPNIIPFYGAYKYGQELCLLFPVLDMNLKVFFAGDRSYGHFRWDFTFIAALKGLSSALSCVHEVRLRPDVEGVDFSGLGYHHDLRPANILVTKETFVLADFGLGRLKPAGQDSRTRWKAGAGDYIAPECMDENFSHEDVGRAIDVWAFGCLVAEVMTFMRMGSQGLEQFCQARISPGRQENCETSYFHDHQGEAKDSVRRWLDGVILKSSQNSADGLLHSLVLDILLPVTQRPKISNVSVCLSLLNVKAHLCAVMERFNKIVEADPSQSGIFESSMKIWFERERLRAFGKVMRLDSLDRDTQHSEIIILDKCAMILKQLFERLQTFTDTDHLLSASKTDDALAESEAPSLETIELSVAKIAAAFAADIQNRIQELWDVLPKAQLRKTERIWLKVMLELDKVGQLGNLEQALSAEEPSVYQEGAALAMMKQIRLELSTGVEHGFDLTGIELNPGEIVQGQTVQGHQVGTYQGAPVIIEWMYYNPSWEAVPPRERAVSMA